MAEKIENVRPSVAGASLESPAGAAAGGTGAHAANAPAAIVIPVKAKKLLRLIRELNCLSDMTLSPVRVGRTDRKAHTAMLVTTY